MRILLPFRQLPLLLFCAVALMSLGLGGCRSAGSTGTGAMAPTLANGDNRPLRRNVADPNAPFVVKASRPVLTTREPILDVNGVPTCAPAQLTAFESAAQTTGTNHSLRISILNRQDACRLGGFPSVSLLGPADEVLGSIVLQRVSHDALLASLQPAPSALTPVATDDDQAPSPQVLLPAKGEADFELGWTSGGQGCAQVSHIAVAAPGTTQSIVMSRILEVCGNKLLITAVNPPDNFNR